MSNGKTRDSAPCFPEYLDNPAMIMLREQHLQPDRFKIARHRKWTTSKVLSLLLRVCWDPNWFWGFVKILGADLLVISKEGEKVHSEMKKWLLWGAISCFDTATLQKFCKGWVYCREKTNLNLTSFHATRLSFPGLLHKHQSEVTRSCIGLLDWLKAFAQTLCLEWDSLQEGKKGITYTDCSWHLYTPILIKILSWGGDIQVFSEVIGRCCWKYGYHAFILLLISFYHSCSSHTYSSEVSIPFYYML